MINTRMSISEMIKEYGKDRVELDNCCDRFSAHLEKTINRAYKLSKDKSGSWWWEYPEAKQYRIGGIGKEKVGCNTYRVILKFQPIPSGRYKGKLIFISTVYSILPDWNTGRNIVILWPCGTKDSHLLYFESKFFAEYQEQKFPGRSVPFVDVVDDFMKSTYNNIQVYTNANIDPEAAIKEQNLEFMFSNGFAIGHADVNMKTGWTTYIAKHFISCIMVEDMRRTLGLGDSENLTPINLWNAYHEATKPKPVEETVDIRYTDDYDWEEEQRKERERILEELSALDDY